MRITIDEEVDMAYIYLKDKIGFGESNKTIHMDKGGIEVVFDIDINGKILGIEIFNAFKVLPEEVIKLADIL